jgi:hypothetical protein
MGRTYTGMRDLKTVRAELDTKREQVIEVGMRLGLSHPETVKLSQEVDELHNEHMRIELQQKPSEQVSLPRTKLQGRHCLEGRKKLPWITLKTTSVSTTYPWKNSTSVPLCLNIRDVD